MLALITLAHGRLRIAPDPRAALFAHQSAPALIFRALAGGAQLLGLRRHLHQPRGARRRRAVGAATLISLVVAAVLFVGQTTLPPLWCSIMAASAPAMTPIPPFLLVAKQGWRGAIHWANRSPASFFAFGVYRRAHRSGSDGSIDLQHGARPDAAHTVFQAKRRSPGPSDLLTTAVTLAVGIAMVNRVQPVTAR